MDFLAVPALAFLAAANADAAPILSLVPASVQGVALLWCFALAVRAVLRHLFPNLDWFWSWDATGPGVWSWEVDRTDRSVEIWAGRLYLVVDTLSHDAMMARRAQAAL